MARPMEVDLMAKLKQIRRSVVRRWALWRLARSKRTLAGYKPMRDAYAVETWDCDHEWVIEDRRTHDEPRGKDWNLTVVCRKCRGARCGYRKDPNPCRLVRHHLQVHVYEDGTVEPVGGMWRR